MNDIAVIALGNGGFTIVDADLLGTLNQHKWVKNNKGYAYRSVSRNAVFLHRIVNKTPDGVFTDHINGFPLDNRRCNLRSVTAGQNARNRKKSKRSISNYKGVSWNKIPSLWVAQICIDGKITYLGCFKSETEAAQCYNDAAIKHYGEFARLNKIES